LHLLCREQHRQTVQRLAELESELKQLKSENECLKREMTACAEENGKLRVLADRTEERSKAQQQKVVEHSEQLASVQQGRGSEIVRGGPETEASATDGRSQKRLKMRLRETGELLDRVKAELSATRRRLSEVQERLTVSEQVTAATRQRDIQQDGDNAHELLHQLGSDHQTTAQPGIRPILVFKFILFLFLLVFVEIFSFYVLNFI